MYSIIENGGFQHKVAVGECLEIPLVEATVGSDIKISQVLLYANGGAIKIGQPTVADSEVVVRVLRHDKDDKVKVFKKQRRKGYRRTRGHRQDFSEVFVQSIRCGTDVATADPKALVRAIARVTALAKLKIQIKKPTRAEKVAASKV